MHDIGEKSINEFKSKFSSMSGSSLSVPHVRTPPTRSSTITPEQTESISLLDAEIQRANNVISEFLDYRRALSRRRNSLLPAINLPQEILEMIFEWACLPVETRTPFSTSLPKPTRKPRDIIRSTTLLFIASVCSKWRMIALGAQQLWNDVEIKVDEKDAEKQAEMLSYWLSKSGQRPLKVVLLEMSHKEVYEDPIVSTAVIKVLVAHAHRLHFFDLILPDSWERALIKITSRANQLTRLVLRCLSESSSQQIDLSASLPQLCDVALVGFLYNEVSLPLAQMQRLRLDCLNAVQCFEVLRLCPQLHTLLFDSLHFFGNEDSDEELEVADNFPPITHNALEVLEIRLNTGLELTRFLKPLTLPALCSFTSRIDRCSWRSTSIPPLLPLVARSGCKLDTLCLVGSTDPLDLAECLQKIPSLRELLIYNQSGAEVLDNRVLALMNPKNYLDADGRSQPFADMLLWNEESEASEEHVYLKGSRTHLGANLETLFVQGRICNNIDDNHGLVEFLAHRWYGPSAGLGTQLIQGPAGQISGQKPPETIVLGARLRSVTLINTRGWVLDDADVAVVQKLQSEGMYIELSDSKI